MLKSKVTVTGLDLAEQGRAALYERVGADSAYAMIDPVTWPGVDALIAEHDPQWMVFSGGPLEPEQYRVLARIIRLDHERDFTGEILNRLPDAGVIFTGGAEAPMEDLVLHLWNACYVGLPSKKRGWLRLHEPYVLRGFMAFADPAQTAMLYGDDITGFIACAGGSADSMLHYARPAEPMKHDRERIVLTETQLEALDEARYELFITTLSEYVQKERATYAGYADMDELRARVREQAEAAQAYGLQTNDYIRRFALLGAERGWGFHGRADAQKVLTASYADPVLKMQALEALFAGGER